MRPSVAQVPAVSNIAERPLSEPRERRYAVVTYGCQMNVHDSEKLANLLEHEGLRAAADRDDADLLVINTCSIRDKAENQLYTDLGLLRTWKRERRGRVLGVGGCVAQQQGDRLLARFPHLDFVFGTHNLRWVPAMLDAALEGERSARTAESRSLERFDLPAWSDVSGEARTGRAFVTVMEGCDMFCSFCIVPLTRGREISRPADAILAEVRGLAERGVREITLLGQTVNAYGRHDARRGVGTAGGTLPFAELLARLDAVQGIERIRYTSPHPVFFDDALMDAHRRLGSLCPHVHLPMQSGSSPVLERMRRRYDREGFLELVGKLKACRDDLVLTTDVIVGFPGETRKHFEETLSAVRQAGFVDSYSFKYSPRPGTQAADLGDAASPEEAQERLEALQQVQRELTLEYHRSRVGTRTRILVEGPSQWGRKGTGRQVCGRDPYHRVVNVDAEAGAGTFVEVEIVEASPHSLIGRPLDWQPDLVISQEGPGIPDSPGKR
jgi:tRNA-2-methylthio-N6-dimethylallyladenosine synthase